jgi:hypothetical protein
MSDAKSNVRYAVRVRADEAFGHKGVVFWLSHEDPLPEAVYEEQIPAHQDRTCSYLRSAVGDTFDADEVRQLQAYFCDDNVQVTVEECGPPVGVAAPWIDLTGNNGFYRFWEAADWTLPFRVRGYYDLHHAESGRYRDRYNASEAARNREEKSAVLQHYERREPRLFTQYDGHNVGVGHQDPIIRPDAEGHSLTTGLTWELMHGADVRVLIPATTSKETAVALLRKIAAEIECDGLWTPERQEALERACREPLEDIPF